MSFLGGVLDEEVEREWVRVGLLGHATIRVLCFGTQVTIEHRFRYLPHRRISTRDFSLKSCPTDSDTASVRGGNRHELFENHVRSKPQRYLST